jgi:hypothetical protein
VRVAKRMEDEIHRKMYTKKKCGDARREGRDTRGRRRIYTEQSIDTQRLEREEKKKKNLMKQKLEITVAIIGKNKRVDVDY